jgi:hypothetical protein
LRLGPRYRTKELGFRTSTLGIGSRCLIVRSVDSMLALPLEHGKSAAVAYAAVSDTRDQAAALVPHKLESTLLDLVIAG